MIANLIILAITILLIGVIINDRCIDYDKDALERMDEEWDWLEEEEEDKWQNLK